MKQVAIAILIAMGSSALGITGPAGTKVTFGSNWIRWKQDKQSFDRHNNFGKAGYVRAGGIKNGCLVYGPYIDLPHKGHLKAWVSMEALVGTEEFLNVRRFPPRPNFSSDTPMFKVELTADSGRKVLASRLVRFKNMRKWTGKGWRYGRCTAGNPCTAGTVRTKRRTFFVYTDYDASDIIGKRVNTPYDDVEVRICDLNHKMTKVSVYSTTIELTY